MPKFKVGDVVLYTSTYRPIRCLVTDSNKNWVKYTYIDYDHTEEYSWETKSFNATHKLDTEYMLTKEFNKDLEDLIKE